MRRLKRKSGLSHVEVVLSTLLIGLVVVGSLVAVAAVTRAHNVMHDSAKAELLAQQLMSEIVVQPYEDTDGAPSFGGEWQETGDTRTNFDDVDDYHSWAASPPQDRSGAPLVEMTGWRRAVTVEWVDSSSPDQAVGLEQGVKRITVTVSHNGQEMSRLVALRTDKYEAE